MPAAKDVGEWESTVAAIMRATNCSRERAEVAARRNGYTSPAQLEHEAERDARLHEKQEQAYVARLFREFGFKVRNQSQARASKVAPGTPDLWCMHRELPIAFWWETKRQVGGRFSADQIEFRADCVRCGVGYGAGDRHAARTHLIQLGLAHVVAGALEPIRRLEGTGCQELERQRSSLIAK